MHKILIYIFVAISSTYAVAAEEDNVFAEGAKLYNDNCARCHNARPAEQYSQREWSVIMPHMRVRAHLTGNETLAVEAFISRTLTAESIPVSGDRRTGEELVKAYACIGCHTIGRTGGTLGPSLENTIANKGIDFVVRKLLDPTMNNPATSMPKFPMDREDALAIAGYLETQ